MSRHEERMDNQQDVYRKIFDEVMEAIEKGSLRDGHFVLIRVEGEALTDWSLETDPILFDDNPDVFYEKIMAARLLFKLLLQLIVEEEPDAGIFKKIRALIGFSRNDVAIITNSTANVVRRLEEGKAKFDSSMFGIICQTYGVLLQGVEDDLKKTCQLIQENESISLQTCKYETEEDLLEAHPEYANVAPDASSLMYKKHHQLMKRFAPDAIPELQGQERAKNGPEIHEYMAKIVQTYDPSNDDEDVKIEDKDALSIWFFVDSSNAIH